MSISPLIDQTISRIGPLDQDAMAAARERQDTLTKPLGSLGRLEELSVTLAGIMGEAIPEIRGKCVIVAAADHGVAQNVSGEAQARRREQARAWMWSLVEEGLQRAFRAHPGVSGRVEALEKEVEALQTSPARAARTLLGAFREQ